MSLASYVEARCIPEPNSGCWLWLLSTSSHGYGSASRPGVRRTTTAHRLSYEAFKGPIPNGLTVDHLCRNKLCVNPDHLELVTRRENTQRGAADRGRRRYATQTEASSARASYRARWARDKYARDKAALA